MARALFVRLAIGATAICAGGSVMGYGLANFAESGSFHFYKQPRMTQWAAPDTSLSLQAEHVSYGGTDG